MPLLILLGAGLGASFAYALALENLALRHQLSVL
jgi:hypothetical protein